jgi:carbamate kinase
MWLCRLCSGGGGGIPVVRHRDGSLHGVEAVIDKDLAAARLALDLEADVLLILTDVAAVFVGYKTPGQRALAHVTVEEMERHTAAGELRLAAWGPRSPPRCSSRGPAGAP